MSTMSPVLEAFLAGQRGRSEVLQAANENKIKREHLDQLAKQFDVESKQKQQELDLHLAAFKASQALAHAQHGKELQESYASGLIPSPQTQPIGIPGMPDQGAAQAQQQSAPTIPGMPQGFGSVAPPTGQPAQNVPVGSPISVTDPMGTFNFPRPMNPQEQAVAQQQALAPGLLALKKSESDIATAQYKGTIGNTKEEQYQMMRELADEKLKSALALNSNTNASRQQIADANNEARLARTQLEITRGLINAGVPPEIAFSGDNSKNAMGNALARYTEQHGKAAATGAEDVTKLSPLMKSQTQSWMSDHGYAQAPADIDKTYAMGTNAVRVQQGIENLYNSIKPPTSIGGKVKNILSDKLGLEGLSTYKSQYDMFKTSLLPVLDTGVGLTPGTLARSPKLYDKLSGLLPLVADGPEVVTRKQYNANDIFLTGIQAHIGKLSDAHKQLIWQKVVNDNPELLNNHDTASALKKAVETGHYTSGDVLGQHLKAMGLQ